LIGTGPLAQDTRWRHDQEHRDRSCAVWRKRSERPDRASHRFSAVPGGNRKRKEYLAAMFLENNDGIDSRGRYSRGCQRSRKRALADRQTGRARW